MSDDLSRALATAWHKLRPRLEHDPRELQKRLARRHSKLINQPPRAWCLALRASDTRLADFALEDIDQPSTHDILVDSDSLKLLTRPVHLIEKQQSLHDVADQLGTTK